MKIVMLEKTSLGDDVNISALEQLGELVVYDTSTEEETRERVAQADVILVNKVPMNARTLEKAAHAKLLCVTATGTNIVDMDYCRSRNLPVTNVDGYSTDSVAQHTFALLFYVLEKLNWYDAYVKSGAYSRSGMFCCLDEKFFQLKGKTWGIIGLGTIGREVARIAEAFGCRILCYSATGRKYDTPYEQVDLETLLGESDVVSIHAPLNPATENLMTKEKFAMMKKSAILINVGRGPIVNEKDLAEALNAGVIAGAGLDVLSAEPMKADNPLLAVQDSRKLVITPHIAWASVEARQKLVDEVAENVRAWMNGTPRNLV